MKTFKGLFILFFFRNFFSTNSYKKRKNDNSYNIIAVMMLLGISPSIIFEKV